MNGAESLLSYLDAPIVVGDPDGRAVYVNPAFEERFPRAGKSALGLPLAELFDGGAREAVLRGVVTACEYLAHRGLIGKASTSVQLTRRSNVTVEELAFFGLGDGGHGR